MLKTIIPALLAVSLGCGGGQKPDQSASSAPTEYAPLRDSDAPAAKPARAEQSAPAASDFAGYNEGKTAPDDDQKALLTRAEADLATMVDKICACPDKPCLEALQADFQSFGDKYRGLENIQMPQDVLTRMTKLGERVTECTKNVLAGG